MSCYVVLLNAILPVESNYAIGFDFLYDLIKKLNQMQNATNNFLLHRPYVLSIDNFLGNNQRKNLHQLIEMNLSPDQNDRSKWLRELTINVVTIDRFSQAAET